MNSIIARKLTLYFAAALLLLCLVIGSIFIALYRVQVISDHKKDMEARAVSIAQAMSEYMSGSSTASGTKGSGPMSGGGYGNGNGNGGGGGGGGGYSGYGAYLRFIDDIAMTDVWIVDEALNLITAGNSGAGQRYQYTDLPSDAETVVKEAFTGKTTFSQSFSGLLDTPTLTVATPILVGGQAIGAVLLHSPVYGTNEAVGRGAVILAVSLLAALLVSVLLSVFLASGFTKPLKKMRDSALLLAEGDYTAKTQVAQHDEIGELAGAIDILSDRLAEAKRESENLDKLRRDFVSNVSHELRTPVTVLRGSLEALCDGVVSAPEQVRDYHHQMLGETLSLQRLVSDLLDLSRLQNTDFKIEMQPLNLPDILGDAVRSAIQLGSGKHIDIRTSIGDLTPVTGDWGRLRQMFLIVLDNAVKFSPEGGQIDVIAADRQVSITDHGPGISPEDLPHIFDRFYKVKSEENKNGSGLGLAIARQIAERHGITLTVESRPGAYTTFHFSFPRRPD